MLYDLNPLFLVFSSPKLNKIFILLNFIFDKNTQFFRVKKLLIKTTILCEMP